jgi:predicted Zn-dependent protease
MKTSLFTAARLDRSCRRWRPVVAGLLLVSLVCGCGPGGGGAGPGHRAQTLGLTPDQEVRLGEKAYEEVLSKSKVVRRGPEVEQVQRVGRRIAKAAEIPLLQKEINLNLRSYRFDWEFNVLRDDHVNAFCLPGGKVAVFTGLLELTGNDDDQLATVISHEVAHALAHHANERITREQKREHALRALNGALGRMDPHEREVLIGLLAGGTQLRSLAYDRQQESEADHIGLFLMTFAGYNPDAALRFWMRMSEVSARRGKPPAILSTHPSDAQRIEQMRRWVPQAKAAKKAFDEHHVIGERR